MVVELMVFVGAYGILWIILQKEVAKLGVILAIAGVIGSASLVGQLNEREFTTDNVSYDVYVGRAKTVFEDIPSRFVEFGIAPIKWAYDSFGFFGAGLGVWNARNAILWRRRSNSGGRRRGAGQDNTRAGHTWPLRDHVARNFDFAPSLANHASCVGNFTEDCSTFIRPFRIFGG